MNRLTTFTLTVCLLVLSAFSPLAQPIKGTFAGNSNNPQRLSVVVLRPAPVVDTAQEKRDFLPPTKAETDFFQSGKDKKAVAATAFRKFRTILLAKGVPFEPNILLEPNWRNHLKNYSSYFDSLTSLYFSNGKINGAIVADNLFLPSNVEITRDTVILANNIYFEGTNIEIKGSHNIAFFPVVSASPTTVSTTVARKYSKDTGNVVSASFETEFFARNKIVKRGKITIEASGRGYDDWLKAQKIVSEKRDQQNGNSLCDEFNLNCPDSNGTHGQPGEPGIGRGVSPSGIDSPDPVDGSCVLAGNPNGQHTNNATDGYHGIQGGDAPNPGQQGGAMPGGPAGNIFCSIPDGSTQSYVFNAIGGTGGPGGPGGQGGTGGPGGQGKRGGDGVTCGLTVGNGGNGGAGGQGGNGGKGGKGGNGAKGGNGGDVFVELPSNFLGNVTAYVNKGPGGNGGYPGPAGNPGEGQTGGRGGTPGPNRGGVFGTHGTTGVSKCPGLFLGEGDPGIGGMAGDSDGTFHPPTVRPGGGGGGEQPPPCNSRQNPVVDNTCGCTPYYWVEYWSWDGGQTWEIHDIWYAGCW